MKTGRLFSLIVLVALLAFTAALRAQTAAEPTVHQIYQAAESGDLRGARAMIDEVIAHHPKSGKAHYVKAELAARANDGATARSELETAEKLSPGLPFAKPESVSALRTQVQRLSSTRPPAAPGERPVSGSGADRLGGAPAAGGGGFPFGAWLLIGGVVIAVVVLLKRRRAAPPSAAPGPYAPPPYARDDAFGRPATPYGPGGQPFPPGQPGGYPGAGGYPAPGGYYPPPAAPQGGLGRSIAGGLATGLAVGAGAVAAQEIGRRMFEHGHDGRPVQDPAPAAGHPHDTGSQIARDAGLGALDPTANADMGGADFGIADDAGWDDGGVADAGGDDWDT